MSYCETWIEIWFLGSSETVFRTTGMILGKIEKLDFRGCSETFLRTFDPEHFKLVFLLVVYLNHVTSLEWVHSMYRWFNPAPCNTVTSHLYHLTSHLYHLTWHHSVWKTDFRFGCSQNGLTRTPVLHHYRQNIPYLYNKLVIVFLQPIGCIQFFSLHPTLFSATVINCRYF